MGPGRTGSCLFLPCPVLPCLFLPGRDLWWLVLLCPGLPGPGPGPCLFLVWLALVRLALSRLVLT
jgi:hypothetical protein